MTDVLVKKNTLTNLSSLKIKENQKVNHGGDSKINYGKTADNSFYCNLIVICVINPQIQGN